MVVELLSVLLLAQKEIGNSAENTFTVREAFSSQVNIPSQFVKLLKISWPHLRESRRCVPLNQYSFAISEAFQLFRRAFEM